MSLKQFLITTLIVAAMLILVCNCALNQGVQ